MIYIPHPMPAADLRMHTPMPTDPVQDPPRNPDEVPPPPDRRPDPPDSIPNPMPDVDPQQTPGIDHYQDEAFEATWRRATREL